MLLSSRDELLDDAGNATGEYVSMSDPQVRDEVLTIFLAGYETVANGLTWTWYLLSQNPEVEARLHAELDAVLGPDTLVGSSSSGGLGHGTDEHTVGHAGALYDRAGRTLFYEPVHDGPDGRILSGPAAVRPGTL